MKAPTTITKLAALLWLFLAACDTDVQTDKPVVERDTIRDTVYVAGAGMDSTNFLDPMEMPVTLPVLDAMFQDSTFAGELRDSLQLTDQQITELRKLARISTGTCSPSGPVTTAFMALEYLVPK